MKTYLELVYKEPYRLFFFLGTLLLLWGVLIWLPLIWTADAYPVLAHRYLVLNGFAGSFIGGFLMTAVPKFSQTWNARRWEVWTYLFVTLAGIVPAYLENSSLVFILSSCQPLALLAFLLQRIPKREANPPYSFVFIFVGLFLWFISGILSAFVDSEGFKHLHYEGAIACIILGVGSRLIPGILGHVEIVQTQREKYERPISIIKTVPLHFLFLIIAFVGSYLIDQEVAAYVRAFVVAFISFKYWKLWMAPKDKTALTWCIWISSWMILVSFVLKVFFTEGLIHIGHAFFINGIVLLSLLIGTRVLQSHGPQDKKLENARVLYVITAFIMIAAATRVGAFFMPESYLRHLAYSSIMLSFGTAIWSYRYLRFVRVIPS